MEKKKITFLTNEEIKKSDLIAILKNQKNSLSKDDEKILNSINLDFDNFFNNLSPQEIYFLKTNPHTIWVSYLIFRYKFKNFPKTFTVSTFPIYLLIEPVSSCNLRCIMCFQIDESFSKNQNFMGMMNIDLFKNIIDQAVQGGTQAITLASRGEPTLHPKLDEMLEYCTGKFLELKINTNATLLNEKLIHKILQSGVTDVYFL